METLMKLHWVVLAVAAVAAGSAGADAKKDDTKLDARTIVDKVVDADPFGMMDSTLTGRA